MNEWMNECSYHKWYWKPRSKSFTCYKQFKISFTCYSYVICMYSYVALMSFVCNPYVTLMYSHVIRMSLICTHMSFFCHSYILVCHSYFTRMYSNVIRMSLVCDFTMNPFLPSVTFLKIFQTKNVLFEKSKLSKHSKLLNFMIKL